MCILYIFLSFIFVDGRDYHQLVEVEQEGTLEAMTKDKESLTFMKFFSHLKRLEKVISQVLKWSKEIISICSCSVFTFIGSLRKFRRVFSNTKWMRVLMFKMFFMLHGLRSFLWFHLGF